MPGGRLWPGLVVAATGEESWDGDVAQLSCTIVGQEIACHKELGRSPHRLVDQRPFSGQGTLQWLRPGTKTTEMALIEFPCGLLIFLRIGSAMTFLFPQNRPHRKRKARSVEFHIVDPVCHRKSRTRENEAGQTLWFGERIVNGEHASPGMPEEVNVLKVQSLPDLPKVFAKTASLPESGIVWPI